MAEEATKFLETEELIKRVRFELEEGEMYTDVDGVSEFDHMIELKIESAKALMEQRGVEIADTANIADIIVLYAVFLLRAKGESGEIPIYLRKMMDACMFQRSIGK